MKTSAAFNWFSSILIFTFTFSSILVCAAPAPAPETEAQNRRTIYPHYIVPIYEEFPDYTSDTLYTGDISYTSPSAGDQINLLVGFDVPPDSGGICYIQFVLPIKTTNGYPWVVTGSGKFDVYRLESNIIIGEHSWNNKPGREPPTRICQITQPKNGGKSVVCQGVKCKPGSRFDVELVISPNYPGSAHWYELDNPPSGIIVQV